MTGGYVTRAWIRLWMLLAGPSFAGRLAGAIAAWAVPPHFGRVRLARLTRKGFVALSARVTHKRFAAGPHLFIDDRVLVIDNGLGGSVQLGTDVRICRGCILETGPATDIVIGDQSFIQPHCQLSAHKASIRIGRRVQIASTCAFYSYDHGFAAGMPIWGQPLTSRGDIVVGDDAWFGHGVIVLSGVQIGDGAVVGAGSVVTRDVPPGAIAVGNPARVVAIRGERGAVAIERRARLHG